MLVFERIGAFRGESKLGNFFVDMWRVVFYTFLPVAFLLSIVFLQQGSPMTFDSAHQVSTLDPAAMGTGDNDQPKQNPNTGARGAEVRR
jgi:K+-transporting ATPase ATPase A chain